MANFNKVILIGNLTRDPEIRYTPKGSAVCKVGLAVNRVWRDDSGTEHEEVLFVDVDVWGKQAEAVSKYLSKGSPCFVEGRLKLDTWDDKETGQKKSKMGVTAERVQFLGAPRKSEFSGDAPSERPQPRRAAAAQPAGGAPAPSEGGGEPPEGGGGDDIPF